MNGRAWTQEELLLLGKLQKFYCPQSHTAKRLNRTVSAVKSKASDVGFLQQRAGKWTAEEESKMYWLISLGITTGAIGLELGRSGRAVRAYLNRIGMSCAVIIEGAKSA